MVDRGYADIAFPVAPLVPPALQIRKSWSLADTLGYISEEGMIAATNQAPERLCTACFTGSYPVPLPEEDKLGKSLFELEVPVDVVAEAVARP